MNRHPLRRIPAHVLAGAPRTAAPPANGTPTYDAPPPATAAALAPAAYADPLSPGTWPRPGGARPIQNVMTQLAKAGCDFLRRQTQPTLGPLRAGCVMLPF